MLTKRKPFLVSDTAAVQYLNGMERLVKAVRDLSMARDLSTIQNIVRTAAREMTGADGATFVLRDGNFCHYVDEDAISPLWKGQRFPMEACISGWAMLNRQIAVIENIYEDPRIPADAYRPTFVRSLVMAPIRTAVPIGAIGIYWAQGHLPNEEEVTLIETLADTTAIAIENVQAYLKLEERVRQRTADLRDANWKIERLSLCDDVTGFYNRRGFHLLAEQELKCRRRQHSLPLALFIDAAGLQETGDRLGEETANSLLADAARIIQASLRDSDIIGRIGDDSFCILALGEDAKPLRERLTAAIDTFNLGNHPLRLHLSGGVEIAGGKPENLGAALEREEKADGGEKREKKPRRNCNSSE